MAPPCACHSQRLPSMMSSKLAREWQAPAETTTVRPLKELKISPIIDYVVKPNPVFAQQWFNVMFVTTTTFFAIANFFHQPNISLWVTTKEVCNGGVACSLLKLGSLEKTVIASLFHSGLHSSSPFFCPKNHTTWPFAFVGDSPFFSMKKTKNFLWCQIDFLIIWNFFCSNHLLIRCQTKVLL